MTATVVEPTRHRRASRRAISALVALTLAVAGLIGTGFTPSSGLDPTTASPPFAVDDTIIVSTTPSEVDTAIASIEATGATVLDQLPEIGAILATELEHADLDLLIDRGLVDGYTVNSSAELNYSGEWVGSERWSEQTAQMLQRRPGSGYHTAENIGALGYYERGLRGDGVGVALIDSGVSRVPGLDSPGQVVDLVDLVPAATRGTPFADCNGHGTHLAGLIAGGDLGVEMDREWSVGVAPEAHVVNVRVADCKGNTQLWTVLRGVLDAVAAKDTLNIKVMVLALSVPASTPYQIDPLSSVVDWAWRSGIAVVVAAGNEGIGGAITSPAINPRVIAVGGSDHRNSTRLDDDLIADFSSTGDGGERFVDVVAPSRAIISLRVVNSHIDETSSAQVKAAFMRGSGTSQAAAIAAGAVALIAQERPELSPDELKGIIRRGARGLSDVPATHQGAGALDLTDTPYIVPRESDSQDEIQAPTWEPGDPIPDDYATTSGNRWAGNRWASSDWH